MAGRTGEIAVTNDFTALQGPKHCWQFGPFQNHISQGDLKNNKRCALFFRPGWFVIKKIMCLWCAYPSYKVPAKSINVGSHPVS